MIPRILHHIYFPGASHMSAADTAAIAALRARNPGWAYRLYDAAAARAWLEAHAEPRARGAFDRIDPVYYAARADLLRYLICQREGGVYLDLKSDATRPLDEVLRPDDEYILSQWAELRDRPAGQGNHRELDHVPGDEYLQWFIACAPGHPFLAAVIRDVLANIDRYGPFRDGVGRKGVLRTTGPIAYTRAIHPIRADHPHRMVRFESDLGFVYSRHGDHKSHRDRYGTHYELRVDPVVQCGPVVTRSARVWFGTVRPAVERNAGRARKLARLISGPVRRGPGQS